MLREARQAQCSQKQGRNTQSSADSQDKPFMYREPVFSSQLGCTRCPSRVRKAPELAQRKRR